MATKQKLTTAKAVVKPAQILGKKNTNASPKLAPVKKSPVKVAAKLVPQKKAPKPPTVLPLKTKAKVVSEKKPAAVKKNALVKQAQKKIEPVLKPQKVVVKNISKTPVATTVASAKAAHPAKKTMAKKEEVKKIVAENVVEKTPVAAKPAATVKAKEIKAAAPKAVVLPKITTKTVRVYQPDFTKSVLDKTERDHGAPSQRYSDSELVEFRELIQRKLEAAKKELSYLHGLITRKDELGGDEGDNRYMTMEDGSLSMEREQLSQMASRQITFIDHLEKATMRIENKTYGVCRVTGKLIDKARLRAVPHATLSIEAKMGSVK